MQPDVLELNGGLDDGRGGGFPWGTCGASVAGVEDTNAPRPCSMGLACVGGGAGCLLAVAVVAEAELSWTNPSVTVGTCDLVPTSELGGSGVAHMGAGVGPLFEKNAAMRPVETDLVSWPGDVEEGGSRSTGSGVPQASRCCVVSLVALATNTGFIASIAGGMVGGAGFPDGVLVVCATR